MAALLIGCGTDPPSSNVPPADVVTPTDVVTPADVVDAGGGADVVDAGGGADVVDAGGGTDVVDAGGGTDVVDAGGGTDVVDAGGADVVMPAPGCAMPRGTISLPGMVMPIMGTTRGSSTVPSTTCQSRATGPEDSYTLTVTARTGVILSTENAATNFDTVLSVRRTCTDAMTEVACDDDGGNMPGTSSIVRTVLEPGTYSVLVDGYSGGAGNYVLSASSFAVAANSACASATALTTTPLTGQNIAQGGNASTTCVTGGGGQLWYTVTVPANTQATVRATPTGMMPTWSPVVRLLDSCMATTCLANNTGSSGMPATVTFANTGMTARTYTISVSATSAAATGTFDLSLATQMLVPGTTCEMAIDVPAGMGRMGESTANGGPANTQCQTGTGNQRWYRVSIPAGQRLTTTATPGAMSGRRAVIRYIDSCAATTCLSSTAGTTNMPSTLGINNVGMAARTVYVSVSGDSASMPTTFNLATAVAAVVPSSACDAPVALTHGMMTAGDTARGVARPTRCQTADMGPEVYYSVQVPAGQRVTVRAQPVGGTWRARLRSLWDCTATSCFSNTVAMTDGGEAVMALDNPSQLPRNMIVTVSPTTTATGGAFNITATAAALSPAPVRAYAFTTIPAACDDVAMGTVVAPMGGWDDDSNSAVAALPFTVRFLGADATHFSVTSNGFAQLYPNMMGTPDDEYSNATIPTAGSPNNFIAPFWDDLAPVDAMTTGVRTATLGTMPNRRFVIAWNNWRTIGAASTERLTFQAKVFETTNVVELHYCTINAAAARGAGSSATIGIEDAMGMRGNLIANDQPNVVATGTAFRLTPQ